MHSYKVFLYYIIHHFLSFFIFPTLIMPIIYYRNHILLSVTAIIYYLLPQSYINICYRNYLLSATAINYLLPRLSIICYRDYLLSATAIIYIICYRNYSRRHRNLSIICYRNFLLSETINIYYLLLQLSIICYCNYLLSETQLSITCYRNYLLYATSII